MASRDEILAFAAGYLELDAYPDYGPMGLQVLGSEDVTKIACGVSASRDLFVAAGEAGAQLVLVHHGLFWDKDSRVVDRILRGRLKALFDYDLTLAGYHLALDAHPELGNNALLAAELGVETDRRFTLWGYGGKLAAPTAMSDFSTLVQEKLGRMPLVFSYGPETIERVAIVTGEADEPTKHAAKEAGIHFIAGGHYATETLGVRALAAKLADEFALQWEFLDLPNPV
jgi:putative NIF3 family GTP cyclohydrolase 1 type 2